MTELVAWLSARIAEDQAVAVEARNWEQYVPDTGRWYQPNGHDGRPTAAVSMTPHRAVADCIARRRIVEEYQRAVASGSEDERVIGHRTGLEYAVRLLALPYTDRDGYDPQWAPGA